MSLCIPRHQDVREKSVSVVFNIFQYLSFLAKMLYPSTNILVKVMIKRIFCCSALSALYFSKLIVNQHGSLRHYYMSERERERERRGSDS